MTVKSTLTRMEERQPGEGVPAGWLPEIRYVLKIENIPKKDRFVHKTTLKKDEPFLLRQFLVISGADSCDIMIQIGSKTVLPKTRSYLLSAMSIAPWPASKAPLLIKPDEGFKITLFAKPGDVELPSTFECLLRGAEHRA